jgi:glycosyltransferase involved in cell wall biosynthesis
MLQQLARWYDVYFLSLGSATDAEAFERAFGACVTDYAFVPRHVGTGKTRLWKIYRTVTGRCDFLPAHDRGLRRLCRQEVFTHRFDAILLSSVLLRALPLPEDVPTIGDTHNAEFDVLRRTAMFADRFSMRQYARLQWRLMRREERRCGRKVDLVLATSARDRQLFEDELGLSDVALVPNGTDLDEFSPGAAPPVRDTILFSGLMSYYPNQQAIRWFVNTVLPLIRRRLPAARLVVAGASPPHWLKTCAGTHVEITGQVPDIRPYLERATVVVAPLLIGGGTRVKILEALAMAKPVVSTSIGAEGLDLVDGESIVLADHPEAFARHVVDLLCDPARATRFGMNGREHVRRRFDWNEIGSGLSRTLDARFGLSSREAPAAPALPAVTLDGAVS